MAGDRHRAAWEEWGQLDPLWAALAWDDTRHGRWDVDRFLATGVDDVATMLALAHRFGLPARHDTALDFGCGVGRLTRALAPHFHRTVGLDVAPAMIAEAHRLDAQRGRSGAEFVVHLRDDLSLYPSRSVDFVSSLLVLQHLPARELILGYMREFVRVLAPGGVALVQLPTRVPPEGRVRLRTQATRLLRAAGVRARFLYERTGWQPEMRMTAVAYDDVVSAVEREGGRILDAPESTLAGGVVSRLYVIGESHR